jgi:Tol biopolymer transport system component
MLPRLWLALLMCFAFLSAAVALGRALPRADQLLVETDQRSGLRDLRLIDTSRALAINLTHTPLATEASAEWSADGEWLTYIYGEVMIRDVCVRTITRPGNCQYTTGSWDDRPRWSPDGTSVIYQSVTFSGDVRMSLLPTDLSSRIDLFSVGGYLDYSWSPDSSQIVFTTGLNYPLLHVVPVNLSRHPQRLFFEGTREYAPAFSPDGRWMAYISENDDGQDIYRVPTSCLAEQVTCDSLVERLTTRNSAFSTLDWSPDSRSLLYASRIDTRFQVVLLDVETRQERMLTEGNQLVASPRFSPDGRSVSYLSGTGRRFNVYILSLAEGAQPQRMTSDRRDNWSPIWRPRG